MRWLVTGATGQLGGHVVRQLTRAGAHVLALCWRAPAAGWSSARAGGSTVAVQTVELSDFAALERAVDAWRPTHVLHLAAMTAVADCHANPAAAERINVDATRVLVEAARRCAAHCLYASTDMVFDGAAAPYAEDGGPAPLSHYGRTKLAAEAVIRAYEHAAVIRIPLLYGLPAVPRETTFARQVAALRTGAALRLFTDEYRTPVALCDAARALIGLARAAARGILHLPGPERLSRLELVARCAGVLGIERTQLAPTSRQDVPAAEPRPADLSLCSHRLAREFPALCPGPLRREAIVGGD